jgi:hypothetical protein
LNRPSEVVIQTRAPDSCWGNGAAVLDRCRGFDSVHATNMAQQIARTTTDTTTRAHERLGAH